MAPISTQRGDNGYTRLRNHESLSKAHLRIEVLGQLDEFNATLGVARAFCPQNQIAELLHTIQRTLLTLGARLAEPKPNWATDALPVDTLTQYVKDFEQQQSRPMDWVLPGDQPAAAFLDLARTVCRRCERSLVRLHESEPLAPQVLAYINRLSDLLWLLARQLEHDDRGERI